MSDNIPGEPAPTKILLLGGTIEASRLAQALADTPGIEAVLSYAGRVERPKPQPIATRTGGFGGIDGLADYLRREAIDRVIDATHPFAAQMSTNAIAACATTQTPLIALERRAWEPQARDRWIEVDDLEKAVTALGDAPRRVFLAIGRMHLPVFASARQHHYVVRLIDEPTAPPPMPSIDFIRGRGPFTADCDAAMMEEREIEIVVAKNAGGDGSHAKIEAARRLGLPVVMVRRPPIPERERVETVEGVMAWLGRAAHPAPPSQRRGV